MFLVTLTRSGPEWVSAEPMEQQSGWSSHAAFMDDLVARGFIVLGGPLGDGQHVVLAIDAESVDEVRAELACDPWSGSHLHLGRVERWTIRLDGRQIA